MLRIILKDERTAGRTLESMVTGLENAESFAQANAIARALADLNVSLTKAHLHRIKAAQRSNSQVAGAYSVANALSVLATYIRD